VHRKGGLIGHEFISWFQIITLGRLFTVSQNVQRSGVALAVLLYVTDLNLFRSSVHA